AYLKAEITTPSWHSFFYALVLLSIVFMVWEWVAPWRKNQRRFRKGFWLDAFYMFFNVFIFSLIGFAGLAAVTEAAFRSGLTSLGIDNWVAVEVSSWSPWVQVLVLFVVRDFIHWNVHRLLHKSPFLWEFHKVHHSVEEMGFAAHLRFHWMETVVYKSLEYIPLGLIGFGIDDFFAAHLLALAWGHFNHANIKLPLGPLGYVFNNPQMHIWHHAKTLPRRTGVNFGLTLSIWDYLFRTAYIPRDGRDEPLGFDELQEFPEHFVGQAIYPLSKRRHRDE
ncbi:MAG: sterol desaturase family protein, partial [Myxococcales bacterium]|nr:sterol desaturase family protein [Myxococcales bacterium]